MEIDAGGAAGGCLVVIIIIGFILGLVLVPSSLSNLNNAEAQRVMAEAQLERARADREHQQSVNFQHEMMVWTVALKAYGVDILIILAVAAGAMFGGFWIGSRYVP